MQRLYRCTTLKHMVLHCRDMFGGDILAHHARDLLERKLQGTWAENNVGEDVAYLVTCIFLVRAVGMLTMQACCCSTRAPCNRAM